MNVVEHGWITYTPLVWHKKRSAWRPAPRSHVTICGTNFGLTKDVASILPWMGSEPYTYRSLGFNFSENLAKNPVFFAIIREHLGFRFKFGKKQDPVHDGRSANQYKGQFVSFQVSNWVGSCMAWPAMTMTIYWHLYVNLWYKHGYSITTVCDTSIWSHFSPFPKMEPLQTKTSLWHSHEFNGCKFVFSRHSGSWETPMSKESSTSIFARKAEYW